MTIAYSLTNKAEIDDQIASMAYRSSNLEESKITKVFI